MSATHAQATIARDAGMAQALAHAERADAGWKERAFQALCDFAQWAKTCKPQGFTSFDFRTLWPVDAPTTDKAFGAVFKRAAQAGIIRKVGYAPHPERHCAPTPIWLTV